MKALVTGAGGFIASHLVEHLLGEGYDVRALAHYRGDGSIGHLDSDCEVVRGDIRDGDRLKRMTHDVDVIFNLAALISIPHSYASPSEYMSTNAPGSRPVLGTLTATRDFTYVTDTVRGLRMLAECRKARGLEVNIGSERDIPMGGLATLVQCVMYGAASDPVLDESWARPERSEVQRLLSDSSLMNALTGWSPEVPLREAIAATAVWMEMSLDEMPTGRVM